MEPLAALFNNVLNAVRRAVESCDKDRQDLTQTALSMAASVPAAKAFNDRVRPYLARREGAEAVLKNLQPFAQKNNAAELYTSNEKEIADLLRKLDDLQYYPKGTVFPSMGYYGGPYGGSYGSSYVVPRRLIKLARVG
jgi:hypothetical protein